MVKNKGLVAFVVAILAVSVIFISSANSSEPRATGPKLMEGIVGKAYYFDGKMDYIEVKESPSLDIPGNEITISAWVKLSRINKPQAILAKSASGDSTWLAGTKGLNIAGQKMIQSKWDASWDIHDHMFSMAKINPDDIETIETLVIPRDLPAKLDQDTKSQIFQNFLAHAKHSNPGN